VAAAALARAARLLVSIAGGRIEPVFTDVGGVPAAPAITMDAALPERVAGTEYAEGAAAYRLRQVGCTVADGAGGLTVTPPSWRPDLTRPADLVEEVLRLEGLEQIPSVVPATPPGRGLTAVQRRRRAIGRALGHGG